MATDPSIPFQYLPTGPTDPAKTGENFDALLKYIRDRNDGTVSWDVVKTITLIVTGNATVGGTLGVTGATTLSSTLGVTGATSFGADVDFNGNDITELASINGTFISGFRNRIINGDMRIDQRNEGTAVTISGTVRVLDLWQANEVGDGVFTVQQITTTPPTGFTHSLRVTVTTADASIGAAQLNDVTQRIEGTNIRDLLFGSANAKTVTLSFWIRSSVTGTFAVTLSNNGVRNYVTSYTISSANTWEKKTVSIPGDTGGTWLTTNANGMRIIWDLGSGSDYTAVINTWSTVADARNFSGATALISTLNATWDLTGVQLEIGSQATDFEYIPSHIQLLQCQRYFEKTIPQGTAVVDNPATTLGALTYRTYVAGTAGANGQLWQYKVTKRATPSITLFNPSATGTAWRNTTDGANSGASGTANVGDTSAYITNAQVAGDGVGEVLQIHATAAAEL